MKVQHLGVRAGWHHWGALCGAHVFEGFFDLEDKSANVKMKVEARSGTLWSFHISLPCAAYISVLSGSLLCFIVWNPIRKKTLNLTNVRF